MSEGTLKDQIRTMLGDGVEASAISRALGCDPSYISQLMADENFAAEVTSQRVLNLTDATSRDRKLSKLEDLAIDKLEQTIQWVSKPMEAARILQIVNGTKRRGAELNGAQAQGSAPTVILQLPEAARVTFTLNSNSQVVDVDGRSMAPLPSNKLMELAQARKRAAAEALPKPHDKAAANDIYSRLGVGDLPAPAVRNVLGDA
jgi:hypothetical protein